MTSCKVFILSFPFILGCLLQPLYGQSLSGNYTIGNATGTEDYPTLSAAIADLKAGTIAGDVEFNIGTGTYNETMDLSGINNGAFSVTFAGASKEFTIIHPLDNIAADNSGISITNTNNVVLRNFTLEMDDISDIEVYFDENDTKGIHIAGATNIDLEDLVLSNANYVFGEEDDTDLIASAVSLVDVNDIAISSSELSGAGTLIYLDDFTTVSITTNDFSEGKSHIYHDKQSLTTSQGLTISGNTFTGPYVKNWVVGAITLNARWQEGAPPIHSRGSDLMIEDNVIDLTVTGSNDQIHGISLDGWDGAVVSGNTIEDGSIGIQVASSNACDITSNQVYRTTNFGFYYNGGDDIDVINNIITSSYHPVSIRDLSNVRFIHNTFSAFGTLSALTTSNIDHFDLINNIFHVANTVVTEVYLNNVDDLTMDRNLFSGNANTNTILVWRLDGGYTDAFFGATLDDWQADQALYDQNSQSFDPVFAGADDYHISDATNYRFGTAVTGITTDIDGDVRDEMVGIDIGADQYVGVPPASPPSIVSFSPVSGPVGTQITLFGTNFDPEPTNNTVFFGATQGTVISSSENEMVVTVPFGATFEPITVFSNQLAAQTLTPFHITFESDGALEETSFDETVSFDVGDVPERIAVGDLDNDGLTDLVVARHTNEMVSILRNTSSGSGDINFAPKVDHVLAGNTNEVLLEDFNGDGYLDIVVGYTDEASFSIFENTTASSAGGISFGARQDISTTTDSYVMAATDINADGQLDLVVVERNSDQLLIFENTSTLAADISFSNNSSLITGDEPTSVAVADIDLDGLPDLIVGNRSDLSVSAFVKDGTPFGFAAKQDYAIGTTPAQNIVTGDMDQDGVVDIVISAGNGNTLNNPKIRLLLNTSSPGSLGFTLDEISGDLDWIDLDDLNGDGKLDLVYMELNEGVLINRNLSSAGTLSFDAVTGFYPEGLSQFLVTGDLDNDGEPDVIMTSWVAGDDGIEVARNLSGRHDFISFSMAEQSSPAVIDLANQTISIDVAEGTDPTGLISNFSLSPGASVHVAAAPQQSGVTVNDFSSPLQYAVTAEDGSIQNWTVTVNIPVPTLSGTYTIGTATGTEDYPTLTAAIDDLKVANITGDIEYQIADGVYHETMDLRDISNGDFNITFSGASSEFTIIHPLNDIPADKSGISVTDMNHVVLENFTLEMEGISETLVDFSSNETKGIHLSSSSDVTVDNLVITNADYVYSEDTDLIASAISLVNVETIALSSNEISGAGVLIFLDGFENVSITDSDFSTGQSQIEHAKYRNSTSRELIISRNTFTGPYPATEEGFELGAIFLDTNFKFFTGGGLKDSPGSDVTIEDNVFDTKVAGSDDYIYSIYIEGYDNVVVRGNKIYDGSTGIYVLIGNTVEISANEIYNTSYHGLDLAADNDVEVFNNIITSSHHPVHMWQLDNTRLAYNTLSATGTRSIITTREMTDLSLLNNIFHVENTVGTEVYIGDVNNLTMDFNLFSGNANTHTLEVYKLDGGYDPLVGFATLSDWQTSQTLYAQNSQSFDPTFVGADDYHITDATNYRFGTAIADITTDIDGHDRTQSGGIDVGADQYLGERGNISGIPRLDDIKFEFIQPTSSPVVGLDFLKGTDGENIIYDMDGDGDNDFLFFARAHGRYQYVAYLNDGDQHYRRMDLSFNFGVSNAVTRPIIRAADLNMDGINDLVVGGERIGNSTTTLGPTRVFFGDTDGQLYEQNQIDLNSSFNGEIRIEDFNGDTWPDIFILEGATGGTLYLNDGSGSFSVTPMTGFTDSFLLNLAVSTPYNGGVDVIAEIWDGGRTNVIYRYESGVFTEVTRDFRTFDSPSHAMEFGDANADGFPDIFILDNDTDPTPHQRVLYLNDQSGNYTLDTSNDFDGLASRYDFSLHFTDLNNDGAAEVLFVTESEELAVFWNNGSGNYAPHQTYAISNTAWVTVGDVNGDGFPDIVNSGSRDPSFSSVGEDDVISTYIYINDHANGFDRAQLNVFPEFRDGDIQLLDANEDGHEDMLVSGAFFKGSQSLTELYLNDGAGAFTQMAGQPFEGLEHASIAKADFNGDTHEDVILSGLNQSDEVHTKLYIGDGAGSFSEDASNFFSGVIGASVALDANSDEYPDVLVIGNDGTGVLVADLYLNDGTGSMTLHGAGLAGLDSVSVAVGDIDADEDVDLLIQGVDGSEIDHMLVYTNDGAGNFTEVTGHGLEVLAEGKVLLFDVDGDTDLDVYLSGSGQFLIYTNDGSGNFTETQREEGPSRSSAEYGDIDLDGDLDLIESGQYGSSEDPFTFVYFNDGSGHFIQETLGELHGIFNGAMALGDLDADLDIEILLSGSVYSEESSTSRIYRNTSCGTTSVINQQVTSCHIYDFYGTMLSTSGNYMHVITSADGCERTVNLDFTFEGDNTALNETACDSYAFDGEMLTASGQYNALFTNQHGCDSLVTLDLTILEPTSGDDDVEVCESYEWEGNLYTVSGTYQEILINSVGCDSTATLNLTILEPIAGDDEVQACESYEWEGTVYSASGTYQEILTNSVGCDSTATLNLTILEPTSGDENVEACESYEWEGNLYTTSGTYQEILTNSVGCDSTATLNLIILEPTSGDENVVACESYEWEGNLYTASGTYQEILTNSVGCDSTATLNLTILEPTSGNDALEACESYEWEGNLYTASGTYQEILTNSVGCDSTATLNLTILEPTSGDENVEACESYEWEGTVYTASGTYQEILTNSVGCDSTATLNLTILEPTSGDDAVEACESYEWEGNLYTTSGTYQEILTNLVGCDSTATLNLIILEPTSGDENVEACESYEWEGNLYTASGTYQEILTNSVGCDSTATLNLTILEPTSGNDALEACESYEWEGNLYTASGTYQEILTNSVGCDSTATLNLTILEPTSGDENVEACESYEWEGTVYTASGTYQEILTNSVGCDSTATLNLTILEPTSGDDAVEACESYEWEGNLYTTSGTYQEILTNLVGCDSTATLNLIILEPTSGDENVEACESYEWEGNLYTASGTYQEILTNSVGCDSTATLNLTILEPTSGDENVEACESYEWEGTLYTASGTYQEILTNSVGCDSTATLNLTILEPTSGDNDVEACESYEWEGTVYTASGTYQEILTNTVGCDSTATLNLTILESNSSFTAVEACGSYNWNGQTLTENGIHEITLTNAVGCDSLAILDLTLLESTLGEADVFACGSYEWEGVTYETSGIFETILTASNGCDSLATLNLTIGQQEINEVIMDVCSDYTFGSQQITTSGIYQETFSNSLGCDSTVVLTAEVFDTPSNGVIQQGTTLMAEINAEGLNFQWYDCSADQKIEGEVNREFTPVKDGLYSVEISNGVCIVQSTCFDYMIEENVLGTKRGNSTVSVYPNPTTEKIKVSFPKADRSEITIYGLDGRLIVTADVKGQTMFEYDLPERGVYFLKVNSSSGQQEFIKVLKK